MSLKLGTATYAYLYQCSLEKAIENTARQGFRFIEIMTTAPHLSPGEMGPWSRKVLRQKLADSGVELVALNPTFIDINLISLNEAFRELSIKEIIGNIQLAADLGAKMVVVMAGRRHGLIPSPMQMSLEVAVDSIGRCLQAAEKYGIFFGLENGPANFIQTGQQVVDLVDSFNHPKLKVVYDVANASMVEPVMEGLRKIQDHLIHFHLSDTHLSKWGHLPIGEGCVDFVEPTEFLKEINYQGVGVLEITSAVNLEESIEKSVSYLRNIGWGL